MVVAVRHASSGETEGWNFWSHAPWQALGQVPSSSVWTWPYSWHQSTHDTYRVPSLEFHGKYISARSTLDYSYHSNYSKSRQLLQDQIVETLLNSTWDGPQCATPVEPWIVFTAGAMGAGKSYTIRQLAARGHFPLSTFVAVDPDDIRGHLPEFNVMVEHFPQQAGEWTRKEAGYISELLTRVALEQGRNVLVDGSLRDAGWYKGYFEQLRHSFSRLQIGILHITAPRSLVLMRAHERSKTTGRLVPIDTLEDALKRVPKSVDVLKKFVDFHAELHNSHELHLRTGTWESFQQTWSQKCEQ
jgi:hypothetical protein